MRGVRGVRGVRERLFRLRTGEKFTRLPRRVRAVRLWLINRIW